MTTAIIDPLGIIAGYYGARHLGSVVFPFAPAPASRPKVSRWGVYYGKTYKAWKEHAETFITPGTLDISANTPLLVLTEAIVPRVKSSRAIIPKGDVDNYAKGPLDVITKAGGYWHDDRQVVALVSVKRFAHKDESPRTEVHIYACA